MVAEEKQVTERFTQAINQLVNEANRTVRLAGIYTLERIAKDSVKDHWTVMEVLTSFIREESPARDSLFDETTGQYRSEREWSGGIPIDIRAALIVIARRDSEKDPKDARLDLRFTGLLVADLQYAEFARADFQGANLSEADLSEANLSETNFDESRLYEASLNSANLVKAIFTCADLTGASFRRANLSGVDFKGANLSRASFEYAESLVPEQIKAAMHWKEAHYDDGFRQQLGLPLKPKHQD